MSSQEEDKKVSSDFCIKSKRTMGFITGFSFPVELTCGHKICAESIIRDFAEEEAELCCQVCDSA